jgi:transcription elongation factor Elf1
MIFIIGSRHARDIGDSSNSIAFYSPFFQSLSGEDVSQDKPSKDEEDDEADGHEDGGA